MIGYLKEKYHWYLNYRKLKHFLGSLGEDKILLFGYPKSGNTWLRFLLFNYRFLLFNPSATKTLTYKELNTLQDNVMDRGTTKFPKKGYPVFYRTHQPYSYSYQLFDYKIYIHRNPLDTLISAYYFYKNRDIPFGDDPTELRSSLMNIDFYVLHKLDEWMSYYDTAVKEADIIVSYTDLKSDPLSTLRSLINSIGWTHNEELLLKSIDISSIKNVKNMAKETNQQYGNGPKDGSFKGEFTRSGAEGQYYEKLKPETIQHVFNQFPDFKKLYIRQ